MSIFLADPAMKATLSGIKDVTEIRDADGNVLGVFAPGTSADEVRLYLHAWLTLDPEQVRRQKQTAERTYTTQEVLAHLQSLGKG
jgi:hypothetical protein